VAPRRSAPSRRDDRQAGKQERAKLAQRTRPLRTELQQIDTRLARLAAEKLEVEGALADASAKPEDFAELGRRLAHVAAETHRLEERWLALQAELETLDAAP
jgi:ATP-binding cassette subfamily F protein 3